MLLLQQALWMVIWWITEAAHMAVANSAFTYYFISLTRRYECHSDVVANYGSPIIFLFFWGFVLALLLENVNLHKRIALTIIKFTVNDTPIKWS